MKITLDLPDWHEDRHIRIFYGVELVAMKPQGKNYWRVKTERCNMCGDCCVVPPSNPKYRKMINGKCEHLRKDGKKLICDVAYDRMICFGDPLSLIKEGKCSIKHDIQEITDG